MAGIDKFDISIINDDFLPTAKEQKSGNELKLELIRKIINEEIKLRQFKNIIKYKKPDAKAQIMLAVKRVLMRKGVSAELKELMDEIME